MVLWSECAQNAARRANFKKKTLKLRLYALNSISTLGTTYSNLTNAEVL